MIKPDFFTPELAKQALHESQRLAEASGLNKTSAAEIDQQVAAVRR